MDHKLKVEYTADTSDFDRGAARVEDGLNRAANAAGTYRDAQGRVRDAHGRFVGDAARVSGAAAQIGGSLGKALGNLEKFGAKLEDVGKTLSVAISLPLLMLGRSAMNAYADLDSLTRGLATVEKDADSLQKRLKELEVVARLPGLGFKEAVQGDIRLRATGMSAELAKRSMLAFGNAVATVGGGKQELSGVILALTQINSKGKVFGEEINQINERVPQIRKAMIEAFGTADTEALGKMGIDSEKFVTKIVAQLEKLPKATGGVKNAFENFSDSSFRAMAKLGESIDKNLGIGALINSVGNAITYLVDKFTGLSPVAQQTILAIGAFAVVIPPVLAALGALSGTVLPAVAAGFALITGPVALAIAAVAAAATAIYMHWDRVKKALVDTGVWDNLKGIVSSALGVVVSIFGAFANLFQGDWHNMWEHVKNVFKYAWNGILNLLAGAVKAGAGLLGSFFGAIGLDTFKKNLDAVGMVVDSWVNSLKADVPGVTLAVKPLFEGFNFGGDNANQPVKPNAQGDTGKYKPELDKAATMLEVYKERLKKTDEEIEKLLAAKMPVPQKLQDVKAGYELIIADIEKKVKELEVKLSGKDSIVPLKMKLKPEMQAQAELVGAGVVGPMKEIPKLNAQSIGDAADRKKQFDMIRAEVADELDMTVTQVEPVLERAIARIRGSVTRESVMKAIEPLKAMNEGLKEILKKGAETALIGMGEIIGGLIAGTGNINEIPKLLLGTIGDMASQLGRLAIGIGIGMESIKASFRSLTGVGAIAAGVALVALGAAFKAGAANIGSGKKSGGSAAMGATYAFADGAILSRPTFAAGEYPNAQNNPEVVTPLYKLNGILQNSVSGAMRNIGSGPNADSLSANSAGIMRTSSPVNDSAVNSNPRGISVSSSVSFGEASISMTDVIIPGIVRAIAQYEDLNGSKPF